MSNPVERRKYDSDRLENAKIRFSDFESMLIFFICEVANSRRSRGLGFLRGFGDVPLRVWNEKAGKHFSGPLPPQELFIALSGEWEDRTIQRNGITWDHIVYESPDLITLINNPKHRNAREHGGGTMYRIHRDPSDLGQIFVTDPYQHGRILRSCPRRWCS